MLKHDLIFRNPLRLLGHDKEEILPAPGFGAVLARAGVGKTALLVQLALDSLLRGQNVLHVSLNDPVKKVCLWYDEVFRNISTHYHLKSPHRLWEAILPHRFIMTFQVEGFSVPKLEERLTDLTAQNLFVPQVLLLDGLPFHGQVRPQLETLRKLTEEHGICSWITVRTHRDETSDTDILPAQIGSVADLFEIVVQLLPRDDEIRIHALKGGGREEGIPVLRLDPSTMLVMDPSAHP